MADVKVGEISHYYNKIGVAVVDVKKTIKVGDKLRFSGPGEEFEQTVDSMQIEHENIPEAKSGQSVGMKVNQEVKKGAEVYRVE